MAIALYNHCSEWSDKGRKMLRDMFENGYTDEEMAKQLNRTPYAVARQRRLQGLKYSTRPSYRSEFRINDAMADYYPRWYKKQLMKEWQERQQTYTK